MSQIHVFRGVRPVYYDITWGGGLSDLLQYYNGGGGSLGTPNLYYVIYGRPLSCMVTLTYQPSEEILVSIIEVNICVP